MAASSRHAHGQCENNTDARLDTEAFLLSIAYDLEDLDVVEIDEPTPLTLECKVDEVDENTYRISLWLTEPGGISLATATEHTWAK